ncbi:hypothetical protein TNCT_321581 [Trichonephila clavata]|uniref:Uncharacterized protein n=1 Tax=Trichonephila clavata TaxID=2740835 RepID=A0A8X6LV26_TRICU|nr:hypothetical protein TNCT_321581 [Trichonephila clavata]
MWTLKEVILVELAAGFVNDYDTRKIINHSEEEIWKKVIRERISAFHIPLTLNEKLIALIKSMAIEVAIWRSDHIRIITTEQEWSLKFCFNVDGTVDLVKTANLLIHSEGLDMETRFILVCRYWSLCDVIAFFENLPESARQQILHKYSTSNEEDDFVMKWILKIVEQERIIRFILWKWTNVFNALFFQ